MMQQDSHNPPQVSSSRRQRDGGYLLLAIMLMMAFMIITATYYVAPKVVQQIKRDREEEMIHRGTEYARAIKKYYKKNGRYPASLDDLDKGQIRYLRKRFKDPLTKDGKWKLLNYADIATLLNTGAPGTPAGALGAQGGTITPGGAVIPGVPAPGQGSSFGFTQQQQQSQQPGSGSGFPVDSGQGYYPQGNPGSTVGFPTNSDQGNNSEGVPSGGSGFNGQPGNNQGFGAGNNQQSGFGSSQPGGGQQGNSPFGQNTTGGNTQFGGGAIVGVASMSKDPTIRIYNKKKTYNEWQFIYNPMMDRQNGLLRGPYQPQIIGGTQIGTPAGQMNGQQQSGFGQQQSGFGQQNTFGQQGGFGQQQNTLPQSQPQQPLQPGNNFPPEQSQPQ
jgi:type II secretory pathway pseudopilin PulG